MIARGENKRMMQLPDLYFVELLNEGPTPCHCLTLAMLQGKTNQHARIEHGYAIRHMNVEACSVGALALYFFARFEIENEAFPDLSSRDKW